MKEQSIKILAITLLFLPHFGFSQTKILTKVEFYGALQERIDVVERTFPRRETELKTNYKNGQPINTFKVVSEYLAADRRRIITTTSSAKEVLVSEVVQIGDTYYCREEKGKWRKEQEFCGDIRISVLPEAISEHAEFKLEKLAENGKDVYLFSEYRTYTWQDKKTKKENESFFENKFLIGRDLRIIRRELRSGNQLTKDVSSMTNYSYDYDVGLTEIRPPIK